MSDLKMSDVFAFFSIENHYHVLYAAESINDIAEYSSNNDLAVFNCTEHAEYAAHAINNHDRLVEEIAQLKADKAELLEALEMSNDSFRDNLSKFQYKNERSMLDCFNANKKLLQKHKGAK